MISLLKRALVAGLGLIVAAAAIPADANPFFLRGGRAGGGGGGGGFADACVNASLGAAQHPHLLDTNSGTQEYGKTLISVPSTQVMGVNCKAGPPDGQVYKSLATDALPANASRSTLDQYGAGTGYRISIGGAVVLDGWDLRNAWISNGSTNGDVRITNSMLGPNGAGTTLFGDNGGGATNTGLIEIDHSDIDCAGVDVAILRQGSTVRQTYVHENYFHGGCEDAAAYVQSSFTKLWVDNNLFENLGNGGLGQHTDVVQFYIPAAGAAATGFRMTGNTVIQPAADGSNRPKGMNAALARWGDADSSITLTNFTITGNVMFGMGNTSHGDTIGNVSPAFLSALQGFGDFTSSKATYGTVSGNWVWTEAGGSYQGAGQQGFFSGPWQIGGATYSLPGPYLTCTTFSSNTQMRDGSTLPAPSVATGC